MIVHGLMKRLLEIAYPLSYDKRDGGRSLLLLKRAWMDLWYIKPTVNADNDWDQYMGKKTKEA